MQTQVVIQTQVVRIVEVIIYKVQGKVAGSQTIKVIVGHIG